MSRSKALEVVGVRVREAIRKASEALAAKQSRETGRTVSRSDVLRHWLEMGFAADPVGKEIAAVLAGGADDVTEDQVKALIQPLQKQVENLQKTVEGEQDLRKAQQALIDQLLKERAEKKPTKGK